jgi:predicted deacetylase
MGTERPRLCVSLHDVAPAKLEDCRRALDFLAQQCVGPVSLLVVPHYHGLSWADREHDFLDFMRSRVSIGDEVVLHGFTHRDTAAAGTGVRDWLERRVCTAGEGEFSRLDTSTARTRILKGLAVLRSAGWSPSGFVAPAWLMSQGTVEALESLPFQYYSTRTAICHLKSDRVIQAPSLVVSTRDCGRRALSRAWNQALLALRHDAPVLRVALHPVDFRYPAIVRLWRSVLGKLSEREVLTEGSLLQRGLDRALRRSESRSRRGRLLRPGPHAQGVGDQPAR